MKYDKNLMFGYTDLFYSIILHDSDDNFCRSFILAYIPINLLLFLSVIISVGMYSNHSSDPRRPDKEHRYKPKVVSSETQGHTPSEEMTSDYLNIVGMILSMCGLLLKFKWAAWGAMFFSCMSFATSKVSDDGKQIFSSFMLSISAIVMSYLQNPQPVSTPWSTTNG